MKISDLQIAWDVPVPTGYGRSSRRRTIRLALNEMVKNKKTQVCFRVPRGEMSDADARRTGDVLRSSIYGWRNSLGQSAEITVPVLTTTVNVTETDIELHVYDKERATFATE